MMAAPMRLWSAAATASPRFRLLPAVAVTLYLCGANVRATGESPDANAPAAQTASGLPDSPYFAPQLHELMDECTFRLSFDANSLLPDLAAGPDYLPKAHASYDKKYKTPRFAPGLIGQAMVLGTGQAQYPSLGNAPLATRGSVAFWIKPEQWKHDNDGGVLFFYGGPHFLCERQGPSRRPDGRPGRQEQIFLLARSSARQARFETIWGGIWDNGQWHFVVANWSWPQFQMSVDGGAFRGRSLRNPPDANSLGAFMIGSGGASRALLDEVIIFRRPLTVAEAKLLFEHVRGAAPRPPAHREQDGDE